MSLGNSPSVASRAFQKFANIVSRHLQTRLSNLMHAGRNQRGAAHRAFLKPFQPAAMEVLEQRLLLTADFDLWDYSGTSEFLLEATPDGSDIEFTLYDRNDNSVLKQIKSASQEIEVSGSGNPDDLNIDFSALVGGATPDFGSLLSFTGRGGVDIVRFTGAIEAGEIDIDAETIEVNSPVSATGNVTLSADANLGGGGAFSDLTMTNEARLEINDEVSGSNVALTAETRGNQSALAAWNDFGFRTGTFTDTAEIIVAPGAHITATGELTVQARRASEYHSSGRFATTNVTGDVAVTIGGSAENTNLQAGGKLTVEAIDELKTSATSNRTSLNPFDLAGNITASGAQNLITGDVALAVEGTTIEAGTNDVSISADRKTEAVARAEGESLAGDPIPDGTTVSLGGIYAKNHLSGSVTTHVTDSSITAADTSVTATDNAIATVKSELTVGTSDFATSINSEAFSVGASMAFNRIDNTPVGHVMEVIDTLLGTNFGDNEESVTEVLVTNVTIDSSGDVTVLSDSAAKVNATVSNTAESESSSVFGSSGSAASALLAGNLINTKSTAKVDGEDTAIIEAAGTFHVSANDNAMIYSNSKLAASSIITNDGGARLLQDFINLFEDYDYLSSDGTEDLEFGDKVGVVNDANDGGTAGVVYTFMGEELEDVDLATIDYSDEDLWKPAKSSTVIPQGISIGDSESTAIGGLVVRNDVRSGADASLVNATVQDTGEVKVEAIENATISATADAAATAKGGSAFSNSGLAAGGIIATNNVLSHADAVIRGGSIETVNSGSGDITVLATNTSELSAVNQSAMKSTGTAISVTLAFNTIGYEPQNTLFNTLDALFGTDIGTADPARTTATIENTNLTATGAITVEADSKAVLEAVVGNEASAAATTVKGSDTMAAGVLLSSNMVATDVDARLNNTTITSAAEAAVLATDDNTIDADITMLAGSSSSNNLATTLVNQLGQTILDDYRYSSLSGERHLEFGDTVRVASVHDGELGEAEAVYEFMGTSQPVNLSAADYTDFGLWKKLDPVNVIPAGLKFPAAKTSTVGGLVVRNDITADVDAEVSHSNITLLGPLTVIADGSQTLNASMDATVKGKGGGLSVATNNVLGGTSTTVTNSDIQTTDENDEAHVQIAAKNSAVIDAVNNSVVKGKKAIGGTLAFNAIGYESQNVLLNALDALITTDIGQTTPVNATTLVTDTPIDAAGDVSVTAHNDALITSSLSNETTSAVAAIKGAAASAAGFVLSSNMVQSNASADVKFTTADPSHRIDGRSVLIEAKDRAGLESESSLGVEAEAVSHGGIDTVADWLSENFDNQYVFTSLSGPQDLGGSDYDYKAEGTQSLNAGDVVLKGGSLFEYAGDPGSVNLDETDFSDTDLWIELRRSTTRVRVANDHSAGGVIGGIYRWIGGSEANVDLANEDYSDENRWVRVTVETADFVPQIGNITASDASAVGVHVVRNDVRGNVTANVDKVAINAAGDVDIRALQQADMIAFIGSTVTAAGGSEFEDGSVLSVNATVATNLVQSSAKATVTDTTINTTDSDPEHGPTGNVTVLAENRSGIEAIVESSTESDNGDAVGVTLAFNTLGWESQNVLFNTIDALLGTDIGNELPASVEASVTDSYIDAAGEVSVVADNSAGLNAGFGNEAGGDAAASVLLASNMLNTKAEAVVKDSTVQGAGFTADTKDEATILATATSVAGADGGPSYQRDLLKNALRTGANVTGLMNPQFLSSDGEQELAFGDLVKVSYDHDEGGDPGGFYRYMGEDGTVDLSEQDYEDVGYWLLQEPIPVPQVVDFEDSEGNAFGGLVVRNDVRTDADALVDNVNITVDGPVTVQVSEQSAIHAIVDSEATANGGTAFGDDSSSLAINAVIATNLVLATADAVMKDSTVTTTGEDGDVTVDAQNTSFINATNKNAASSGGTSGTGTLAFNTIGWAAQNWLFSALDTIIGADAIGTEQPVHANAVVQDTTINASGSVNVTADNAATIRALVSNDTKSKSESVKGGSTIAAGFVLSSNLVSSEANAYIVSTQSENVDITSGGDLTVESADNARITSKTKLSSIAETRQDAGLGIIFDAVVGVVGIDFTDRSGSQTVQNGNLVQLDTVDYSTVDVVEELGEGDRVELAFAQNGFLIGDVFEYIGDEDLENVALDDVDYSDTNSWKQIQGVPGNVYRYVGTTGEVDLKQTDFTDENLWMSINDVNPAELIPGLQLNPEGADATAVGVMIVRNDVRSEVEASLTKTDAMAAGDLLVFASENATIQAQNVGEAKAVGGGVSGDGSSIAVNGVVATNLVLSDADAFAKDSTLTTTDGGDITVDARNTSRISATIDSSVESGQAGVGVTLAFNTVGYEAQNALFNTVDAIVGTQLGDLQPAKTNASVQNSTINADGKVTVNADSDASIVARVDNATKSIAVTPAGGSDTVAVGAIIAMNKVATDTDAVISDVDELNAGAGVDVSTEDDVQIRSNVVASSVAVSAGTDDSAGVAIGVSISRNEIHAESDAAIKNVTEGAITGDVSVTTDRGAVITSEATSSSIGVSAALGRSTAISGGGSISFNKILGRNNAAIDNANFTVTAGNGFDGDLTVTADDTSEIDALVRSLAVSVAVGSQTSLGVAIGLSVAQNQIGWDSSTTGHDHLSTDSPNALTKGDKVKVADGPLSGRVYEYVGDTITNPDDINLQTTSYSDKSVWKPADLSAAGAEVHATIRGSEITASGDTNVKADADASIEARVLSAAAAIAGGKSAIAVSAAGVYTENLIRMDVRGRIIGGTIQAGSFDVSADDASSVDAIAGAASVAAAIGKTAISVSIGLSLAFNEISTETEASISDSATVTSTVGGVNVNAISRGTKLFEFAFDPESLDDASRADGDDDTTEDVNEADVDASEDAAVLVALENQLTGSSSHPISLPFFESVQQNYSYTTADGDVELEAGATVKLGDDHAAGGIVGAVYEFTGNARTVDLATIDYSDESQWTLKRPDLKLSLIQQGKSWMVVTGDGTSYTLTLSEQHPGHIEVSRTNINAIAAAASAGIAIGKTGVAISGAGAVARNTILTKTDARIADAVIASASDVTVNSTNTAVINSGVLAASLAAGIGKTGVGVSLGIAISENQIGLDADGNENDARTTAVIADSSLQAAGHLTLQALSAQRIGSVVFAGSIGVGIGQQGIGVSVAGVYSRNSIRMDVLAEINGDGDGNDREFEASSIDVLATDSSAIGAFAGAASIAAGFGQVGVAVSVGAAIARNDIASTAISAIKNADDGIVTTSGDISVKASQEASIDAIAAAASLAIAAGQTGVGISGAGADSANFISTVTDAVVVDSELNSADGVIVDAMADGSIRSFVLAASVGVGVGQVGVGASIGVALARNFIGWGSSVAAFDHRTGETVNLTAGKKVKIGEGVREGEVYRYVGPNRDDVDLQEEDYGNRELWRREDLTEAGNRVTASVKNSGVTAVGELSVQAKSKSVIDAEVFAGSVAAAGGMVGVGISGVGASTANRIKSDIVAEIDGSSDHGISVGSVTVLAEDESIIDATTGAAALSAALGAVGVGVSISVALAHNEISNTIDASINNIAKGLETVSGDVSVTAKDTATIRATTASAAISLAGGAMGVALSGAGANATNVILTKTSASVQDSDLTVAEDLNINASSNATVDSKVLSAAVSGAAGANAAALAIGAATANNYIGYTEDAVAESSVLAFITGSQVWLGGDLSQKAISANHISSSVTAGATAAVVALNGGAVAVAGVGSVNNVGQKVHAYIADSTGDGIQVGEGELLAQDHSTINSNAGSSAISAALAVGGAISVSVATANNTITNDVRAYISNADVSTAADYTNLETGFVTSGTKGRVTEVADGENGLIPGAVYEYIGPPADHDSTGTDVWVNKGETVHVSEGHTAGGEVGQTYEYKARPIQFRSNDGTQTVEPGDRINTSFLYDETKAQPGSTYKFIGSAAASIDLGNEDYLDTAKWLVDDTIDLTQEDFSNTDLWTLASTIDLAQEDFTNTDRWRLVDQKFTITATENATISANSVAASVAAGAVSIAGGGADSRNTIQTVTDATISNSDLLISGDLSLDASNKSTASSITGTSSVAVGVISIAAGGSTTVNTINPVVSAKIDGDSSVSAGDINVEATATPQGTATTYGVNAGTLAVGGSYSTVNMAPVVSTAVGGTITAENLTLNARTLQPSEHPTASVMATGSSGGLVGINGTITNISHGGSVSSLLLPNSNLLVLGEGTVLASSVASHRAKSDSYVLGLLAAGASVATVNSSVAVTSGMGSGVTYRGDDLAVGANRNHTQFADTLAGSGGIAAGASAAGITRQTGTVRTLVGSDSDVILSGDYNSKATSTATLNGKIETFAGGLLAGSGALLDNVASVPVLVDVGTGASIVAGTISMDAGNAFRKPDIGNNIAGITGGLATLAGAHSETIIGFDTKTNLQDNVNLTTTQKGSSSLALRSQNDVAGHDTVKFTTMIALLSGVGANSIITTDKNEATVISGDGTTINSAGDVEISARGKGDVHTKTNVETLGGVLSVAVANAKSNVTPENKVIFGSGTHIVSGGDLDVSAGTDANFNRDQYSVSSQTDAFAGTVIPIDVVEALANLQQSNHVEVADGATLESARDIRLHAERLGLADMEARAKAVNWASSIASGLNKALGGSEQLGGDVRSGAEGTVVVDGTVRTGINRHQTVTLGSRDEGGQAAGWDIPNGVINNEAIVTSPAIEVTQEQRRLQTSLIDELQRHHESIQIYGAEDPVLKAFAEAEIARIEVELFDRGLGVFRDASGQTVGKEQQGNEGVTFTPRERYVMTVSVEPLHAQAGIIDIRGDRLLGGSTGVLDAPGDVSVTITNHTPAQLEIMGIVIPDSFGGIKFNGEDANSVAAVNELNNGSGTASFSITEATTGTADDPVMTVENTFKPEEYSYEDPQFADDFRYPAPALSVAGAITGLTSTLVLINQSGDILINAPTQVKRTQIIGSNAVSINIPNSAFSTAGDPYGTLNTLGDGIAEFNQQQALDALTGERSTPSILANSIIIDAEYLNVNGIIQSGRSDYILTIDQSVADAVQHLRENGSSRRFTLLKSPNPDFTLKYDSVEDRIIVEEIRVQGGSIQIAGQIVSTGAGTIRVLEGYGKVSIDNQTNIDVEVKRIDTTHRGQGTLVIRDRAKPTDTSDETITVYGHTEGAQAPVDGTYEPASDWRFGFSVAKKTATRTSVTYGSSAWLGADWLSPDPDNVTNGPNTEQLSQPTLSPQGTYFYQSEAGDADHQSDYTYRTKTDNLVPPRNYLERQWSTSSWYGKTTEYQTWVEELKQEHTSTHSFKADRTITVDFIGYEEAEIGIQSNNGGRIILNGPLLNETGTTTIHGSTDIVQQDVTATVNGRIIDLKSDHGDIRSVRTNIMDEAGDTGITAIAAGDIDITEVQGVLPVEHIHSTGLQTVTLFADAGIMPAATGHTSVAGGSIELDANVGTIGSAEAWLSIDTGSRDIHVLRAEAKGDIYVHELTDDLHLEYLLSERGDAGLKVSHGSLIDANDSGQKDERTRNELANGLWKNLQLVGSDAEDKREQLISTFRNNKQNDYHRYWGWRNTPDAVVRDGSGNVVQVRLSDEERASYEDIYRAEGEAQGKTGADLDQFVTDAIATLENSRAAQYVALETEWAAYDRLIDSDDESQGSYAAGDLTDSYIEDFKYTLTEAETKALVGSVKVWTEDELLYSIGAGLLKEVTDTQTVIEDDNIKANASSSKWRMEESAASLNLAPSTCLVA